MPWITDVADAAAVWLWIVFIGLLVGWQVSHLIKADHVSVKHRAILGAIGLLCLYLALIYGVSAGASRGLKHLVHRSRPYVQQTIIVRVSPTMSSGLPRDGSFPSGHACNAFMIAVILAEWLRRKRYVFYGLATVVALRRIYVGVHYPSDVIAGSCLGLVITWLMLSFRPLRNRITREDLILLPELIRMHSP